MTTVEFPRSRKFYLSVAQIKGIFPEFRDALKQIEAGHWKTFFTQLSLLTEGKQYKQHGWAKSIILLLLSIFSIANTWFT